MLTVVLLLAQLVRLFTSVALLLVPVALLLGWLVRLVVRVVLLLSSVVQLLEPGVQQFATTA